MARTRRKEKNRRSRVLTVAAAVLLAVLGMFLYITVYVGFFRGRYEPKTKAQTTDMGPVLYRSNGMMDTLLSFRFRKLAGMVRKSYVIPGMRTTRTLQGEFHALTTCTSMTPQGLCVTEDYLVISAYCHTLRHNSVLYLLDRKDGRLLKTIPMAGQAHVGGLAYDPVNRNIWVSGGTHNSAKAIAYRLSDLEQYDEDSKAPVPAAFNYTLATMVTNSYMNYAENSLIAGIFRKKGRSEISWFTLTGDGGLRSRIFEDYDPVHETVISDHTAVTSGQIQGVCRNGDYLLLSKSYGMNDSYLQIYEYEEGKKSYQAKDAVRTWRMPEKLEQICEADGQLFCLFEAGAYAYRAQPVLKVDRVLVFDIGDLMP